MKLKTVSLVVSALISSSAFATSGYQYNDGLEIKLSDENKNASIIKRPDLPRPTLLIENPDSNNISHNRFDKFNVGDDGLYINNKKNASVIINEVVSGNPSTLTADIRVVGNDASLIIANPNGITCSGCSFTGVPDATLVTAKITGDSIKNQPMTYKSIDGKINIINTNMSGKNSLSLISNNISINNSKIKTDDLNITLLTTENHHTQKVIGEQYHRYDITSNDNFVINRNASKLFIDNKSALLSTHIDIKMKESNFINNGVIGGHSLNIESSNKNTYTNSYVDNGNIINMVNNGKINSRKFTLFGNGSTFENNGDISSNFSSELYGSTFVNNGSIDNTWFLSNEVRLTMDYSKFINNATLKAPKLSIKYGNENQLINNGKLYITSYNADTAHDNIVLDSPELTPYVFKNSGEVLVYDMRDNKYKESSFFN